MVPIAGRPHVAEVAGDQPGSNGRLHSSATFRCVGGDSLRSCPAGVGANLTETLSLREENQTSRRSVPKTRVHNLCVRKEGARRLAATGETVVPAYLASK